MGVNQGHQSTRITQALINLALLTGNIGRPGTGANSITGQCNAMGSRIFGNTSSLLGGRHFENPADRAAVATLLDIPESAIPSIPSLAYDQIIDGIEAGTIRALWVIATNPAHSWINQGRCKKLRDQLDFLVVQDMYASTETATMADLVLPAAGWGEKNGTFINSERRIGVTRKVARAPGQALADFAIFPLIAEAWGCGDLFRQWSSPEAAFRILANLSRDQPCDFSGIADYDALQLAGGDPMAVPCRAVVPDAQPHSGQLAPRDHFCPRLIPRASSLRRWPIFHRRWSRSSFL
ncbi:MAG: molybdopterin-dependent oxidoreductase [Candidatus Synoicihabitans palmerolidicus]|nr:molybdopterin-dependent oxidoreductase [Candidatus Synoicihabitans palmerolidicus]